MIDQLDAEQLTSIPAPLVRGSSSGTKRPTALTREQFETTDEFEDALGYWQSHVADSRGDDCPGDTLRELPARKQVGGQDAGLVGFAPTRAAALAGAQAVRRLSQALAVALVAVRSITRPAQRGSWGKAWDHGEL